jgi:hypothetical protein
MTIIETGPKEYDAYFTANNPCFNTAAFAALNQHRCEEIRYLLFSDGKIRAGIIIGRQSNAWSSPFSAPFGGFSTKKHQPTIEQAEKIVEALITFLKEQKAMSFRMTLPPLFYEPSFLTKIQSACISNGFTVSDWDLNYYFETRLFGPDFVKDHLSRTARHNWLIACQRNLSFEQVLGEEGLRTAYDIIRKNREQKGYYLSMTEEDIIRTSKLIPTDSFIVTLNNQVIASAILYRNTPGIVQVIYWGDLSEHNSNRTMYFLTYKLFEHYAAKGIPMIDAGPAMIDEKPNYGLCEFKESIGCAIQPKLTLVWKQP